MVSTNKYILMFHGQKYPQTYHNVNGSVYICITEQQMLDSLMFIDADTTVCPEVIHQRRIIFLRTVCIKAYEKDYLITRSVWTKTKRAVYGKSFYGGPWENVSLLLSPPEAVSLKQLVHITSVTVLDRIFQMRDIRSALTILNKSKKRTYNSKLMKVLPFRSGVVVKIYK